jgi:hypothetical protein
MALTGRAASSGTAAATSCSLAGRRGPNGPDGADEDERGAQSQAPRLHGPIHPEQHASSGRRLNPITPYERNVVLLERRVLRFVLYVEQLDPPALRVAEIRRLHNAEIPPAVAVL